MPTLDTALAFFGLSILLSLSPGPDNVFVLMQSATQGRKAGLLGHTAAVALGLAALLVFGGLAWFASLVGAWFQRSTRAQRALNWSAGAIFIGLAARLAGAEK